MTPEEKIAKVLKQIKDEAAINPDPHLMKFNFNYSVVGSGILSEDEERRILFKLEKEGVIELRLSQYKDNKSKKITVVSSADGEKYVTNPYYWVEILEGFEDVYNNYSSHLDSTQSKKKRVNKVDNDLAHELIDEIGHAYSLGDQELLEARKLEEVESRIISESIKLVESLDDEIFSLKLKKLISGWRNKLKSGFHNRKTAETSLEKWREFLLQVIDFQNNGTDTTHEAVETIKNRFKSEGLFVETRSQGGDLNLIIGKRDGSPDKAHLFIDEKTGEIRVEDNQQEPTELVTKIEAILTLPDGRKIRTTREAIEDLG